MASFLRDWTGGFFGGEATPSLQSSGMLSKQQLLQLFQDCSAAFENQETKNRIADAVREKREAVTVTTEVQEELFIKMGIDPKFGIDCLGKVNSIYADDRELMIKFYDFVSREEMACEEAELGPEAFKQKMEHVKKIQQQQLGMLQQLRSLPVDQQRNFLQGMQSDMRHLQPTPGNAAMSPQEIHDFFQRQQQTIQQKASQTPQVSQQDVVSSSSHPPPQSSVHQRHS
ncbi:unnamed protein product [Sphagnum jensenii]|uniref:Uncharacterized protein n=1 Tax=Sphagnum jensenii TaxID=128206 RepID=A0ABP1A7C9_9BRYO